MMSKNASYLLTLFLAMILLWFGNQYATKNLTAFEGQNDTEVEQARVTEILDHQTETVAISETENYTNETIIFKAEILRGDNKGTVVTGYQNLNTFILMQLRPVDTGDKVILYHYPDETVGAEWSLGEYQRTDALIYIAFVFAALLILFGRRQGINTLVSLSLTVLAIFFVFIPAILSGFNIYFWTIVICIFVTLTTLLIINGYHSKSYCAIIGCFSGVLVSAGLTLFLNSTLKLTGFIDEDSAYLMFVNPDNPIDLKGIIYAAILIGALGAIMDVAMSIASSLYELKQSSPNLSRSALFRSGLNIGKDIMGTMSNTLILAYIGSSLSFVLLMVSYNPSVIDVLNREVIVTEILQALIGSLGILFTMPLTAFIAALLYSKNNEA
ncbi:YibE/F family protein [Fusibacter paucivorans]|uniref:YibE/F family protein n=1 Tax=Fusibacter paucivorans TaxID=76009 RepID=UPI001FE5C3D5|nr:YibE/F family protein [Fusibacter paucivorans]